MHSKRAARPLVNANASRIRGCPSCWVKSHERDSSSSPPLALPQPLGDDDGGCPLRGRGSGQGPGRFQLLVAGEALDASAVGRSQIALALSLLWVRVGFSTLADIESRKTAGRRRDFDVKQAVRCGAGDHCASSSSHSQIPVS